MHGMKTDCLCFRTIEFDENATAVRWLMAVSLNVNSRQSCNRPSSHGGGVKKGMFCAGPFEGGKDTCQGEMMS
jgi:hypothetical protein